MKLKVKANQAQINQDAFSQLKMKLKVKANQAQINQDAFLVQIWKSQLQ